MNAPKHTGLQVEADLIAQAEAAGVDAGAIATRAIRRALDVKDRDRIRAEIRQDISACDTYVAEYGSFAEMMREHYARREQDGPASV